MPDNPLVSAGLTKLEAVNEILEAVDIWPVAALDPSGTSDATEAERVLDRENVRVQGQGWPENTEENVSMTLPVTKLTAVAGAGTFTIGETVTATGSGATGTFSYRLGNVLYLIPLAGTFLDTDTALTGADSGATMGAVSTVAAESTPKIGLKTDILAVEGYGHKKFAIREGYLYDLVNNTTAFSAAPIVRLVRKLDFADTDPKTKDLIVARAKQIYQRSHQGSTNQEQMLRIELSEAELAARGPRIAPMAGEPPRRYYAGLQQPQPQRG